MTYPVYIGDRAAGTMTVTAAGEDHLFEVICHPPEPGLWRVWVQGEGQRLALGLLEGGRLRRRFSRRITGPLGPSGGPGRSPAPRGTPRGGPPGRRTAPCPCRRGVCAAGRGGGCGWPRPMTGRGRFP